MIVMRTNTEGILDMQVDSWQLTVWESVFYGGSWCGRLMYRGQMIALRESDSKANAIVFVLNAFGRDLVARFNSDDFHSTYGRDLVWGVIQLIQQVSV